MGKYDVQKIKKGLHRHATPFKIQYPMKNQCEYKVIAHMKIRFLLTAVSFVSLKNLNQMIII